MRDPCCPDCAQSTGACPMHSVTVYPAYSVGYGTTPVIGAPCPECTTLRARLATAEVEVERMKLVVMAHKTWENEAVAQASNANLALNKIRTENAALRARHAAVMERVRRAVNAVCSCGGSGPDDEGVCAACLVWHRAALEAEA